MSYSSYYEEDYFYRCPCCEGDVEYSHHEESESESETEPEPLSKLDRYLSESNEMLMRERRVIDKVKQLMKLFKEMKDDVEYIRENANDKGKHSAILEICEAVSLADRIVSEKTE